MARREPGMDETRQTRNGEARPDVPGPAGQPEGTPPAALPGQAGGAQPGRAEGPSAAELQDRWQRAVAELDNQRKRYERQLEQVRRAERDRVTAAWLPVLDHLELALQHAQADAASIVTGVRAVQQQALDVLVGLGYRRVDEVGARFDPSLHEAAQVVQAPDAEANTVVAVLRPGYAAENALLRPAVVTVAAGQE